MKVNYLSKNIIIGFIGLIIIIFLLLISPLLHLTLWSTLVLCTLVLLILAPLLKRTNNFISGLIGEKDVGEVLKSLDSNYICIDSGLDTATGNIDKIVVGPTGVWTLEIKSHKGNIDLSDNFLKQAFAEAKYLEHILFMANIYTHVQPILVFSNKYANVRFGLKQQNGVYIIRKEWLNKLLTSTHIRYLDGATVLKIKEIIETQ